MHIADSSAHDAAQRRRGERRGRKAPASVFRGRRGLVGRRSTSSSRHGGHPAGCRNARPRSSARLGSASDRPRGQNALSHWPVRDCNVAEEYTHLLNEQPFREAPERMRHPGQCCLLVLARRDPEWRVGNECPLRRKLRRSVDLCREDPLWAVPLAMTFRLGFSGHLFVDLRTGSFNRVKTIGSDK